MKEQNIFELLASAPKEKWISDGILKIKGLSAILTAASVEPLLTLMEERKIDKLYSSKSPWYLTSDGYFNNPTSAEFRTGFIENLKRKSSIFRRKNPELNPYFVKDYDPTTQNPKALSVLNKLKRKLAEIDDHIIELEELLKEEKLND